MDMYIYIYIYRERERYIVVYIHIHVCVHIYIYIYTHIKCAYGHTPGMPCKSVQTYVYCYMLLYIINEPTIVIADLTI